MVSQNLSSRKYPCRVSQAVNVRGPYVHWHFRINLYQTRNGHGKMHCRGAEYHNAAISIMPTCVQDSTTSIPLQYLFHTSTGTGNLQLLMLLATPLHNAGRITLDLVGLQENQHKQLYSPFTGLHIGPNNLCYVTRHFLFPPIVPTISPRVKF